MTSGPQAASDAAIAAFAAGRPPMLLLEVVCDPADQARLECALSADERARAERLRQAPDRLAYIAGRATVRAVLGQCCGVALTAIEIAVTDHGKPYAPVGPALNLSHSGDRVLAAFSWAGEVGVDVERERALHDLSGLAGRVLSAAERRQVEAEPAALQARRFLRFWTRKEALAKAVGLGLQLDLRTIDASVTGCVRVGDRSWRCEDLPGPEGFVAAIACDPALEPPPVVAMTTAEVCRVAGL